MRLDDNLLSSSGFSYLSLDHGLPLSADSYPSANVVASTPTYATPAVYVASESRSLEDSVYCDHPYTFLDHHPRAESSESDLSDFESDLFLNPAGLFGSSSSSGTSSQLHMRTSPAPSYTGSDGSASPLVGGISPCSTSSSLAAWEKTLGANRPVWEDDGFFQDDGGHRLGAWLGNDHPTYYSGESAMGPPKMDHGLSEYGKMDRGHHHIPYSVPAPQPTPHLSQSHLSQQHQRQPPPQQQQHLHHHQHHPQQNPGRSSGLGYPASDERYYHPHAYGHQEHQQHQQQQPVRHQPHQMLSVSPYRPPSRPLPSQTAHRHHHTPSISPSSSSSSASSSASSLASTTNTSSSATPQLHNTYPYLPPLPHHRHQPPEPQHRNEQPPRERRFECAQCLKRFLRRQDLNRHSATHLNGFKPFRCDYCGTGFTRQDALHRHGKAKRCLSKRRSASDER
ncbi:uncharacterized protein SPPG_08776 [Spizellomyces punctatus DAOM BR117]|uniref:C2H2-type domain-containing protein n=1 Tax=Spizellomyces punctatus (strain DAOM BR117) TaxID=645134 RepID=A0A0L0H526_SPIPD|nr:uncharacterized protein SPPG_08776 [Spizellomyces punctatus DAOM BR117]KNC95833.1 hypothetical protein SPPG_08776 [Spizellomyces punctatus DAOM BR117]|eukprot:XP_016603873.1 hypothetical protein SPPG_08776 [Spizellomyces punctatus DAOM BR117]